MPPLGPTLKNHLKKLGRNFLASSVRRVFKNYDLRVERFWLKKKYFDQKNMFYSVQFFVKNEALAKKKLCEKIPR